MTTARFKRKYPYYNQAIHGGRLRVMWGDVNAWWWRLTTCGHVLRYNDGTEYGFCTRRRWHRPMGDHPPYDWPVP